ncbi:MAG: polyribonucleotide nucleotidyltransferase [Candidatus Liptonbacteria bacterium]|nr:polyribonucleotide nucleotidyltransferase [Candidatus Liptonbacteria bacterium]
MPIQRKKYAIEVGGKELSFELSSIAEQANASVIARYGDTVVLVTAVMSPDDEPLDYMPLTVDYEERFYAAGKIIGSRFIRREGRPSEEAVLAGRLVDRTIRPLFDSRMRRKIQVVITVLAYDEENDPEFPGLMGASLALAMSDIPWKGPVAGVRVAKLGDRLVINPTNTEMRAASDPAAAGGAMTFETFTAGAKGRINMIELGGYEASEEAVLDAFRAAQKEIDRLVDFELQIVKEAGLPKSTVHLAEIDPALRAAVEEFLNPRLEAAVYQPLGELGAERPTKREHAAKLRELKSALHAHIAEKIEGAHYKVIEELFDEAVNDVVHQNILEKERRPDGRALDQLRTLDGEVGLLPRTHGSALFVRGNTQALAVTTLAAPGAEQLIETMETTGKRRFLLHYNFPHFSVGETGRMGGPGRREIGHGNLARKAVEPLIPAVGDFPYTIRVVSEILSSNGSSSMATVCASVMSLMDAGVPIKKMAAGIAMGLMMSSEGGSASGGKVKYKVLTDIQGPEDHHGDMDLKAAGTEAGLNALQMDVKVDGLTLEILEKALAQTKKARLEILKVMQGVIASPRPALSPHAPMVSSLKIDPEKIGLLIGPGGKMINGLIKKYALATIDVEEDGSVFVAGAAHEKVEAAVAEIKALTREIKVGEIVEGNIIKILDFGAIVDLGGGKDGMIHVSELKEGFVKSVTDVVKLGDFVRAKVVRAEDDRIGLSLKQLK